ncbi:MAG: cold shock domain-containing protein [Propionibacteriaceae bacterium]|jgi:cold shock CspA family protein|nr:cold shock domain-containing protein [Propionibacteriaceae bacterium]
MALGRVVKFDEAHGFGFIEPNNGGDDVFLHANDLTFPEEYLRVGLLVEYDAQRGDRGLKASEVRLPPPPTGAPPRSAPARAAAPPPPAPAASPTPVTTAAAPDDDEDDLFDVLTTAEFKAQVTEVLLAHSDTLTGQQILRLRDALTAFARAHQWLDDAA